MKLRIRGDSIRVRLKRSEVDRIASGESIVEHTRFPDSVLTYRLEISNDGAFEARFDAGGLAIRVPMDAITAWATSNQVSIHKAHEKGQAPGPELLIEKDFSCLAPGDHRNCEDDSDTFPHPAAETSQGC